MATAAAKYKELKSKMAAAKKQMEETAKKAFTEMSAEFFEENPAIVSFGWAQYTPYWNDGDVCVFSANTDYPVVTFKAKDGKVVKYDENAGEFTEVGTAVVEDGIEYSEDASLDEAYGKEVEKHAKAVSKFLGNFEEEDLETMFGDHMQITVNRKGKVTTEEHEHD